MEPEEQKNGVRGCKGGDAASGSAAQPFERGSEEKGDGGEGASGQETAGTCIAQADIPEGITPALLYSEASWHRENPEPPSQPWRTEARRDYARVIHSPSFRRLQGKMQIFPVHESDFFRNRLTHSLEVAQIAESVAYRLNFQEELFRIHNIDPRVCATAGLVHDLGHPPFGHNGERALDDKMREYGGFEGNAQTLRILSKLEKKVGGSGDRLTYDGRLGLNLTYRTLASILKYDKIIPNVRGEGDALVKGYYAEEADLVTKIKNAVEPEWRKSGKPFKTIECYVMDVADDIAYSTYDLEDCLKAGFLTPAEILSSKPELLCRVATKVSKKTNTHVSAQDVLETFWDMFSSIVPNDSVVGNRDRSKEPQTTDDLLKVIKAFQSSRNLAQSGFLRTGLTSQLVGEFVNGVRVNPNPEFPALSEAYLEHEALKKVEILKHYTYEAMIYSARVKLTEYRGYAVIAQIFDALSGVKGHLLMPDDVRELYDDCEANASARKRVVCDFVAGMTDRYAIEFCGRLHSEFAESMFKPI
jgi:dGTPase